MQQLMDELNNDAGLREKLARELKAEDNEQAAFRRGLTMVQRKRCRNLAVQQGVRRALGVR